MKTLIYEELALCRKANVKYTLVQQEPERESTGNKKNVVILGFHNVSDERA